MQARPHTFFFARLTLAGQWKDEVTPIQTALESDLTEERGRFKYGFFDFQDLHADNQRFAFARLVKYKHVLEGEAVDEKSHQIVDSGLPRGVVAKPELFIHYSSHIVSYRPIAGRVSSHQFRSIFTSLVEAAHHDFFVSAHLDSINEEFGIGDALARFSKISRVSFDLHPTNPSNRPFYRQLDERLKALNAKRLQHTVTAAEGGLRSDRLKDDDAMRGLLMAADGFGQGQIEGEAEGRRVVITTTDAPVRQEVLPSEDPQDTLNQLMASFNRTWDRMRR